MVVGVCRIELRLAGVSSLKAKRSVVRRIVNRTMQRFNAAGRRSGRNERAHAGSGWIRRRHQ